MADNTTFSALELSEFQFETVREDGELSLCRGHRASAPSAILLLVPVSEYPTLESLERLEREYSLRDRLAPIWAARPLALIQYEGRVTLVLEDPGGEPLDWLVGPPMELSQFLRLAVGLVTALGKLHAAGLIHKDIKPANILVDRVTDATWLMGFGIASPLPRQRQSIEPIEVMTGTLAYMAPEQTGRMNRSIDSRSDLYSLGVTLYEMITGILPFEAGDPLEWIYCHIARQPASPDERVKNIPGPLSAVIMKLLAKTPEERYQTAGGVEADLRHCLAAWKSFGRIDPFPLGTHDISDRLLIPEKLYGRESEVQVLTETYQRVVANGTVELVLVCGYSGIGKSSVVNELHRHLVQPRGLFASGKFDQYKRDIPYATLAQAFQTLIRQILGKSDAEVNYWRHSLRKAVGPNGQLIINLISELELVIGKQPAVPDLSPQDAQNRFKMVFRHFLAVFAQAEHPLILFLDDLQWVDDATLQLLQSLLTNPELQHLMLVGAYRNIEVSLTHPLTGALEVIRQAGVSVRELVLAPLREEDLNDIVAHTLRVERPAARPLARLVHEKTGGNPFFTIQFLTSLREDGLLAYDAREAVWRWDLPRIRAKGLTDNVVDLMSRKLNRLPVSTQRVLKNLACLGNATENATLALVQGESETAIHILLRDAVRAELIFHTKNTYTFLHDRVQEAAYALIPKAERAAAHLQIGRVLAPRMAPTEFEENIFEIVNQLDRGVDVITDPPERVRVAELNLIAAKRAKSSTAYASALTYLVVGRGLLPDGSWEKQYELTFALEFLRAECEFLTGNFSETEERLLMLSNCAQNLIDRAAITRLQTELYTSTDQSPRAVETALEYLRRIGVEWSPHPTKDEVRQEYERIWRQLGSRSIEAVADLPRMTDPVCRSILDVLAVVEESAHFTDENLRSLIVARMVNLSLEYGNSDGSCLAYVHFGWFVGPRFGDYRASFRFGKLGLDLVEKHGLERFRARVSQCFGYFVNPWSRHLRSSIELLRGSFTTAQEAGDLRYAVYSCDRLVTFLLAAGDPLADVQREAENGLAFVQKAKSGYTGDIMVGQLRLVRTLRGLAPSFSSFNDAEFNEDRFERYLEGDPHLVFAKCWYWIFKLQARFFAGDYPSALAAAAKAKPLVQTMPYEEIDLPDHFLSSKMVGRPGIFESVEFLFYDGLARAAQYDSASPEEQPGYHEELAAHHQQLDTWAGNCPENFGNRAALVGAEIARIEGRELDAQRLFEKAIRSARENGFVQNEGLANELAARFYLTNGYETTACAYLRNARYCYLRWGAFGKVEQLDRRNPHLCEEKVPTSFMATTGTPVEHLDLGSVIKASHAVSGEIVLEKLIETLLVIATEQAGAQRGLLILPRFQDHWIEAEAKAGIGRVEVHLRHSRMTPAELPESLLRYVIRTQQTVILDDASVENLFSGDEYIRQARPRSVLCLPLAKQASLIGVLYLENSLTAHVFTPGRLTVLEVLASQAAISLDNARLYAELTQENSDRRKAEAALRASEERLQDIVDNTSAILFVKDLELRYLLVNREFERRYRIHRDQICGETDFDLHPHDVAVAARANDLEVIAAGVPIQFEEKVPNAEGERYYVVVKFLLREATGKPYAICSIATDITELKRAAEKIRLHATKLSQAIEVLKRSLNGLARDKNLHRFVNQVLVVLTEQLGAHSSTLWLIDIEQRKGYLQLVCHDGRVVAAEDSDHPNAREPHEWSSDDPGWIALQMKRSYYHYDALNSVHTPAQRAHLSALGVESVFWIPLVFGEQLIGMLSVRIAVNRQIDEEEVEFAQALAQQVTLALELARLAEQTKESALVSERERATRERANELTKANEALLECLDALASVSELDQFLGQVMGAMTRQLGAGSSILRGRNFERNVLTLDLVFQDGRPMAPIEAKYPEEMRTLPLDELQMGILQKPATVMRLLDNLTENPPAHTAYLTSLGIKTLLIIPLVISGQSIGSLTFRFTEDREFRPEEIEIARALASQAGLAIQLTRLAKSARQSAVLAERNELAGEIHDSLAQFFTGISMQLGAAMEVFKVERGNVLRYVERAFELAQFGLSEARRSAFSLQPNIIEESGLTEALEKMVERSNIPGRLRCNFHSSGVPEKRLPSSVQQELLRIAQEAMSNALRHAKPTIISVTLRCHPPDLLLEVTDNGSGIADSHSVGKEGFGFPNMRVRAENIGARLEVRTAGNRGTMIIVRLPVDF